ncbi:hypothetical protein RUM44_003161 [Polyplax serrata]|uniref:RRM domain-containing protein n=1 Tax=Polyplax serrata TaxID=468196 RepID=A0ABR1AXQ6_POLSC
MVNSTLLIKHLPVTFSDKEKEEFLKYFGAKEVRFESEDVAQNVLHRLHQINVLGSSLSVEYAKDTNVNYKTNELTLEDIVTKEEKENEKYYKEFLERLNLWHSSFNFKQPVPCHVKYQYPPPDKQILINITKILVSVPKFYTQVLHLMNKMNLPCPFGKDILSNVDVDIFSTITDQTIKTINQTHNKTDEPDKIEAPQTSSESELSSSEESIQPKEILLRKNYIKKKPKIPLNKLFKPMPKSSQNARKAKFEDIFEKLPEEKESKKIKLGSLVFPTEQALDKQDSEIVKSNNDNTGFGYIYPTKTVTDETLKDVRDEREEEKLERDESVCISEKELTENRISEKDRSIIPAFRNYAEGAPTCRLYIKNLSKTVRDSDLRFIYNRYLVRGFDCEPNMFDIRLMQEGRMKGQAFVTLQNVQLAQKALRETNGYILKDKPLVVQFARSSTK